MERVALMAKKVNISTLSEDQWVSHKIHLNLKVSTLKEIKSYLQPGVKFEDATACQIINATIDMERDNRDYTKDWLDRSNLMGVNNGREGSTSRGSCNCCGQAGHWVNGCPIKREDAKCTTPDCRNPVGHLTKSCRNRSDTSNNTTPGKKTKGGKTKKN